jgi:hypothetical protein
VDLRSYRVAIGRGDGWSRGRVMCVADETASAAPLLAALDAGAGTSPFQRVGHTVSVSAGSVHRAVMLSAEIPFNRAGFVGHAMRA